MGASSCLTQVADFLGMDITHDVENFRIRGRKELIINAHGHKVALHPKIVDSCLYPETSAPYLAHAIVHVGEDLYLSVLSDDRDQMNTLFVLDGAALLLEEGGNESIYPAGFWSRLRLYEFLLDGVVAVYQKKFYRDSWKKVGEGNSFVAEYIAGRQETAAKGIH